MMATVTVSTAAALASAFSGQGVTAGDTVYIAEGTYRAPAGTYWHQTANGTSNERITYRAAAGARVTLMNPVGEAPLVRLLRISGDYVTIRDIEVTSDTQPSGTGDDNTTLIVNGNHVQLLYVTVRDNKARLGVTLGAGSGTFLAYGCLIYSNGETGLGDSLGHGSYLQGVNGADVAFRESLFFDNQAYGFHAYTTSAGHNLSNYTLEGVAAWGNGLPYQVDGAGNPSARQNMLIGTSNAHIENLVVRECFTHHDFDTQQAYAAQFGLSDASQNETGLIEDCVFAAGLYPVRVNWWSDLTFRRNRLIGMRMTGPADTYACMDVREAMTNFASDANEYWRRSNWTIFNRSVSGVDTPYDTVADWTAATGWDANSVAYEGKPTSNWVYVRPHASPGDINRAHVIAYNWAESATITIPAADLVGYLRPGYGYTIASAYDAWSPLASGTYQGGDIQVPHSSPYDDFAVYIMQLAPTLQERQAAIRARRSIRGRT